MICEVCRQTLSHEERSRDGTTRFGQSVYVPHHPNGISLRDAAVVAQCPICRDFWSELSINGRRRLLERYGANSPAHITRATFSPQAVRPTLSLFLNERLGWDGIKDDRVPFTMFNFLPVAEQSELIEASNSAQDQADIDLARSWLQTCQTKHSKCNGNSDRDGWSPTRLLDLASAGDTIRVVSTADSYECLEYVTLSHAWGQAQFIQLTRKNEQALLAGLPVTILPKTFREAVEMTRALGKRYLWIDSLCIRQDRDDLSDWLREASLMHEVYRHGFCNISATCSKDSSEGLFRPRVPGLARLHQVDVSVESPEGSIEKAPYVVLNQKFWDRNITNAPLNKRGWVLQERLLANRVLHFGQDQLLWECKESSAAQTFPIGIPQDILKYAFKGLDPEVDGATLRNLEGIDAHRKYWAHELWHKIANAYTSCRLTYPQDKLVAISGIAKHMIPVLNDDYLAGMWRRFLPSQLLWYVDEVLEENSTDPYIAPSWSWAARPHAMVKQNRPDANNVRFQVKDVTLEYLNDDITGPLTGGYIVLEGTLKQVRIITADYQGRHTQRLVVNGREMLAPGEFTDGGLCYLDAPASQLDLLDKENRLFAMEGQFCELWAGGPLSFSMSLLRCENREEGIFSRVGLHVFHIDDDHQDFWEQLMEGDQNEANLPCMSWNEKTRLHTIRVI